MIKLAEVASTVVSLPLSMASAIVGIVVVGAYFVFMPTRSPITGVPGLEERRGDKLKQ
jgi:hypothetical protein